MRYTKRSNTCGSIGIIVPPERNSRRSLSSVKSSNENSTVRPATTNWQIIPAEPSKAKSRLPQGRIKRSPKSFGARGIYTGQTNGDDHEHDLQCAGCGATVSPGVVAWCSGCHHEATVEGLRHLAHPAGGDCSALVDVRLGAQGNRAHSLQYHRRREGSVVTRSRG